MAKLPALPFVRSGISQGLSANQAYRDYQSNAQQNGLQGTRRQDFLRLYAQTRALRGGAAEAMFYPKEAIPSADQIHPRDTVLARGYGQWVSIYQRSSAGSDFFHTPFLIKTSQPITPAEAEARALAYLDQEPDTYNRVTLGVAYVGTEQFNPLPR